MGKTVIVTAGPTNERIDSVMKITNMSTGSLGSLVAEALMDRSAETYGTVDGVGKLYYISTKLAKKPRIVEGWVGCVEFVQVESAQDLLKALERILSREHVDAVVHSAAVGDYRAKYSVKGEDLAREIAGKVMETYDEYGTVPNLHTMEKAILEVLDNPGCAADDSGKMSSYEYRLMTMMELTPKVIGSIKKISPDTMLIGFKLLDGVSDETLLDVAGQLRERNNADYIVANDLSRIRDGRHWAMVIGKDGVLGECWTKQEIADTITGLVMDEY